MYAFLNTLKNAVTKKGVSPMQTYMRSRTLLTGAPYEFLKQLKDGGNPKYKALFDNMSYQDSGACIPHAQNLLENVAKDVAGDPDPKPKAWTGSAVANLLKFVGSLNPFGSSFQMDETSFPSAEQIFDKVKEKGQAVLVHDGLSEDYSLQHAVNIVEVWKDVDPATGQEAVYALICDSNERGQDDASSRARKQLSSETIFGTPQLSSLSSEVLKAVDAYESMFRVVLLGPTLQDAQKSFTEHREEYLTKALKGKGNGKVFHPVLYTPKEAIPALITDDGVIETFKALIRKNPHLVEKGVAKRNQTPGR